MQITINHSITHVSRACAFCSEAEVEWHVSEEAATRAVRSALPYVNEALDTLRHLLLLSSLSDALKVLLRCFSAHPVRSAGPRIELMLSLIFYVLCLFIVNMRAGRICSLGFEYSWRLLQSAQPPSYWYTEY